MSRTRSEKDQLEEQLKEQRAESNRLQEELTKEQKLRANLKTVLTQATSLLRDIMQASTQWATRAKHREAHSQTPFLILDLKELGLIIPGTEGAEAGGFQIQDLIRVTERVQGQPGQIKCLIK